MFFYMTIGKLGLYLFYFGSTIGIKQLCLIFGVTPATISRNISKMQELFVKKLKKETYAKVKFPTDEDMSHYAALVHQREPLVHNVIGFIDGMSLPIHCSDDIILQNAAYNGYHHDTMCNNVFAFAPTGKIVYCCLNYPGSYHDSAVASELIDITIRKIGVYSFCVDSGFPRGNDLYDKFVGPISKANRRMLAPVVKQLILRKVSVYISLRQASEWGMRALQGSFPRLKSRLTSDKRKRFLTIYGVVLLHNFRTHHCGLNQIAEVFNPHYEQYINIDGYDKISRYFDL
jgi:hypothetical protein